MPKPLRAIAAILAAAAFALGGSGSALASSSPAPAAVDRYVFDDAWCFDFGATSNCTVSHGLLTVTATPDGREIGRINYREVVTTYDDATWTQIGSSRTNSFDRTVFADGGQDGTFSVSHTRAVGDFGSCVITYLLRIVDYELQFERYAGPGCN